MTGEPTNSRACREGAEALNVCKDGQLLIVATNGPAYMALKAYRRRRQIECLFGGSKTRGLNMEDTCLTRPAKLNTLLVFITLAMAWATAQNHPRYRKSRVVWNLA